MPPPVRRAGRGTRTRRRGFRDMAHQRGPLAVGALLLILGGVALGTAVSSYTSANTSWRAAPRFATEAVASVNDHAAAGRDWARTAFDGGLRQCPAMNPEFLVACENEMKTLTARPGTRQGPGTGLLITTLAEEPAPNLDDGMIEPIPERANHLEAEPPQRD